MQIGELSRISIKRDLTFPLPLAAFGFVAQMRPHAATLFIKFFYLVDNDDESEKFQ